MYPYIHILGRTVGTYGLCMAAAFAVVFLLAAKDCKKQSVCVENLLIVGATAVGFGLLGASLLYIFVTYPISTLFAMIREGDFSFLNGGLVFYGSLIGGVPGALLGMRIAKCRFETMETCVVPYLPLGHAIGRIGCLLAGCCHGYEYTGPLAIYYKNSVSGLPPHQGYFPTPVLEAVLNVGVCLVLLGIRKRKCSKGDLLASYLCTYGVVRFITEMFRGDAVRGSLLSVSTSQWISIAMVVVSAVFLCAKHWKREKS